MINTQTSGHSRSLRRIVAISAATGVAVMGSVGEQAHAAPAQPTKVASAPKPVAAPKAAVAPKPAGQAGKLVYATATVNVRARATTSSAKIGLLPRAGHVKALSASRGGWTKVLYKGKVGYISSSYLSHGKVAAAKPTASRSGGRIVYAKTTVTVRSRATTSSAKIGMLPQAGHVKALSASRGGWTKVLYKGKTGYISSGYLSYSKVAAPARNSTASRSASRVTTTGSLGTCKASFYGYGYQTANGERFSASAMTAAHKTMRFGTRLKVTNKANGKSVIVRVNDRGPYISGRCLDLTTGAFSKIASTGSGVVTVSYQQVG
ncbi:septal ring lytic transglycosylase RlpA family protein [Acidipropionibacterium jensenii]|uniref:septal ring lytic transglycosylase RlpA family protein n=1 Tax=Acidipropionibacterium jensenii TaxID=1749 RepID=UPI00110B8D65|nr:septal ring lytic transglycosylase RlpA family protein [Acidipropionibacterium jensenii]QCV87965.1 septal ring lytic transglycosylase RlpA family protein [Acidipropionibacterium jensenii]